MTDPQVWQVQWRLMSKEPRHVRMLMLARTHADWIARMQQARQPSWPFDALIEMLQLTEGDPDEIDTQLQRWHARHNHLHATTGGIRDYQQFLSVLHTQHQLRLSKRLGMDVDGSGT